MPQETWDDKRQPLLQSASKEEVIIAKPPATKPLATKDSDGADSSSPEGNAKFGTESPVKLIVALVDSAPLSKAAALKSYVNVAAVAGRSAGGPVGGLLFDLVGWRCQPLPLTENQKSVSGKKRKVDVWGLAAFALTMTTFLALLDRSSKDRAGVRSPLLIALAVSFVVFVLVFFLTETRWAANPMIPPSLLRNWRVGFYFVVQVLLLVAQFGLVSNIASYFVRTENASNSIAALHITPAPVGNAIGAIVGGVLIHRTKRYKLLSIVASSLCTASFILILLRWHGRISIWESLEPFPAALGVGLLNSTQFVGVSAAVERPLLAKAISVFFLSQQIGMIVGAGGSSALLRRVFRDGLVKNLGHERHGKQTVKDLLDHTRAFVDLPEMLKRVAVESYIRGFSAVTGAKFCGIRASAGSLTVDQFCPLLRQA
ncbi:MAG: hypothetical protein Q9174_001408 [Haloplaca sp. 1 TL-2023]